MSNQQTSYSILLHFRGKLVQENVFVMLEIYDAISQMQRDLHLLAESEIQTSTARHSLSRFEIFKELTRYKPMKKMCRISEIPFRIAIQSISIIVTFTIEYHCYSSERLEKNLSIFCITLYLNAKIISELIKTRHLFIHFSITSYLVISDTLLYFYVTYVFEYILANLSNEIEFQDVFELQNQE